MKCENRWIYDTSKLIAESFALEWATEGSIRERERHGLKGYICSC